MTTYHYDALGALTQTDTVPAASPTTTLVEKRSYDPVTHRLSRLENDRLVNGVLDAVLSGYDYHYDLAGKITDALELGGREVQYSYDKQGRLAHEKVFATSSGTGVLQHDWEYSFDDVGNRLSKVDNVIGANTTYLYDDNDRLVKETAGADVTTYGYDANGNNTSVRVNGTLQKSFAWDHQNRITGADTTTSAGTQHTAFRYNRAGHLVEQSTGSATTRYLRDGSLPYSQAALEYGSDGAVQAAFVTGLQLIAQNRSGTPAVYLHDQHSGVRQLTSGAGVITDQYTYDAFGVLTTRTGTTVNDRLYRSEIFIDATGTYALGVRGYSAAVGRFLSSDPYEGTRDVPHTLHRYAYTHNDPVNYSDPSGLDGNLASTGAVSGMSAGMSAQMSVGVVAAKRYLISRVFTLATSLQTQYYANQALPRLSTLAALLDRDHPQAAKAVRDVASSLRNSSLRTGLTASLTPMVAAFLPRMFSWAMTGLSAFFPAESALRLFAVYSLAKAALPHVSQNGKLTIDVPDFDIGIDGMAALARDYLFFNLDVAPMLDDVIAIVRNSHAFQDSQGGVESGQAAKEIVSRANSLGKQLGYYFDGRIVVSFEGTLLNVGVQVDVNILF